MLQGKRLRTEKIPEQAENKSKNPSNKIVPLIKSTTTGVA